MPCRSHRLVKVEPGAVQGSGEAQGRIAGPQEQEDAGNGF